MNLSGAGPSRRGDERGFTLIELLIVIVVLGIMTTVVVASVKGITDRGEKATCEDDARILSVAAESYFAQQGGTSIPATGVDADRYERTLMNEGFMTDPSTLYDMDADGRILIAPGSRCTTI
jgi:prepilin-type N-terminal cleavage/methylation domain-containing protein